MAVVDDVRSSGDDSQAAQSEEATSRSAHRGCRAETRGTDEPGPAACGRVRGRREVDNRGATRWATRSQSREREGCGTVVPEKALTGVTELTVCRGDLADMFCDPDDCEEWRKLLETPAHAGAVCAVRGRAEHCGDTDGGGRGVNLAVVSNGEGHSKAVVHCKVYPMDADDGTEDEEAFFPLQFTMPDSERPEAGTQAACDEQALDVLSVDADDNLRHSEEARVISSSDNVCVQTPPRQFAGGQDGDASCPVLPPWPTPTSDAEKSWQLDHGQERMVLELAEVCKRHQIFEGDYGKDAIAKRLKQVEPKFIDALINLFETGASARVPTATQSAESSRRQAQPMRATTACCEIHQESMVFELTSADLADDSVLQAKQGCEDDTNRAGSEVSYLQLQDTAAHQRGVPIDTIPDDGEWDNPPSTALAGGDEWRSPQGGEKRADGDSDTSHEEERRPAADAENPIEVFGRVTGEHFPLLSNNMRERVRLAVKYGEGEGFARLACYTAKYRTQNAQLRHSVLRLHEAAAAAAEYVNTFKLG